MYSNMKIKEKYYYSLVERKFLVLLNFYTNIYFITRTSKIWDILESCNWCLSAPKRMFISNMGNLFDKSCGSDWIGGGVNILLCLGYVCFAPLLDIFSTWYCLLTYFLCCLNLSWNWSDFDYDLKTILKIIFYFSYFRIININNVSFARDIKEV